MIRKIFARKFLRIIVSWNVGNKRNLAIIMALFIAKCCKIFNIWLKYI